MKVLKKYLAWSAAVLALSFAVLYVGDWIVFSYRNRQGAAVGSIEVDQFLATPLKGSKTEYDMTGSYQQQCVRSIFPHGGQPACWWVQRHSSVWE